MMSTVFQQVLENGKEIGVKKGEEIGLKKGKEIRNPSPVPFLILSVKKILDKTIKDVHNIVYKEVH